MRTALLTRTLTLFTILQSGNALAVPSMEWTFLEPSGTALTTDDVFVTTRLTNSSSSTESLLIDQVAVGLAVSDFGHSYDFNFYDQDGVGPYGQIHGALLNPGDSIDFVLGFFRPIGGAAPSGDYGTELGIMNLGFGFLFTQGDIFSRTIVSSVPEPDALALLMGGLLCLGWLRIRRCALSFRRHVRANSSFLF
jgi:hypothetical protein